jgi:hypothetical protein
LIHAALQGRATDDDEFAPGFLIWTGDRIGREYGPYLPRLWRLAYTAKAIICTLLGLEDKAEFDWAVKHGHVAIAAWDGESWGEGGGHSQWRYLKVRHGWRPRSWRYDYGWESV